MDRLGPRLVAPLLAAVLLVAVPASAASPSPAEVTFREVDAGTCGPHPPQGRIVRSMREARLAGVGADQARGAIPARSLEGFDFSRRAAIIVLDQTRGDPSYRMRVRAINVGRWTATAAVEVQRQPGRYPQVTCAPWAIVSVLRTAVRGIGPTVRVHTTLLDPAPVP
jgi:hypothetical protein